MRRGAPSARRASSSSASTRGPCQGDTRSSALAPRRASSARKSRSSQGESRPSSRATAPRAAGWAARSRTRRFTGRGRPPGRGGSRPSRKTRAPEAASSISASRSSSASGGAGGERAGHRAQPRERGRVAGRRADGCQRLAERRRSGAVAALTSPAAEGSPATECSSRRRHTGEAAAGGAGGGERRERDGTGLAVRGFTEAPGDGSLLGVGPVGDVPRRGRLARAPVVAQPLEPLQQLQRPNAGRAAQPRRRAVEDCAELRFAQARPRSPARAPRPAGEAFEEQLGRAHRVVPGRRLARQQLHRSLDVAAAGEELAQGPERPPVAGVDGEGSPPGPLGRLELTQVGEELGARAAQLAAARRVALRGEGALVLGGERQPAAHLTAAARRRRERLEGLAVGWVDLEHGLPGALGAGVAGGAQGDGGGARVRGPLVGGQGARLQRQQALGGARREPALGAVGAGHAQRRW